MAKSGKTGDSSPKFHLIDGSGSGDGPSEPCPKCGSKVLLSSRDESGKLLCNECGVKFAHPDAEKPQEDAPSKNKLPEKLNYALSLLKHGRLMLVIDARKEGVRVPQWLRSQLDLKLRVGHNMAVPIPDLTVDDLGVCCTLSFQRSPFYCVLPWSSIYAMIDEEGQAMFWPMDVPSEMQSGFFGTPPPPPSIRPTFQLITNPAPSTPSAPDVNSSPSTSQASEQKAKKSKGTKSKETKVLAAGPKAKKETSGASEPKKAKGAKSKSAGIKGKSVKKTEKEGGEAKPTLDDTNEIVEVDTPSFSEKKRPIPSYLRIVKDE